LGIGCKVAPVVDIIAACMNGFFLMSEAGEGEGRRKNSCLLNPPKP
jgi:hypothetical protein